MDSLVDSSVYNDVMTSVTFVLSSNISSIVYEDVESSATRVV